MNTKDIRPDTLNILLIGDSGTQKTRFMGTVPGIYVFDFDGGMASLRDSDVEYDTFKDAPKGVAVSKEQTAKTGVYKFGEAWPAFFKKLQDIGLAIDKGIGPKALGFDSLTFMSMIAVNKILLDTGHASPHQGTWGAHHEYFKSVFSQVTAWNIPIIATAHIHRDENDLTKVTEKLPLLAGKLAGMIGAFFDEVYYTQVETDKNGVQKATILSRQTPQMRQAKSRWNVPDGTLASYAEVSKFFGKETKK